MISLNAAALREVAKNTAARWAALVVVAIVSLWLARCQGASSARADDRQKAADAATKLSEHLTDSLNRIRALEGARLRDSIARLDSARVVADAARRRADSTARRLSIVGPARAPSATRLIATGDSGRTSAPSNGLGPADSPPDTTRYVAIQRQGDPRLYTVPQFAVDAWNDQRTALATSIARADAAEAALRQSRALAAADSNVIRQQASTISSLHIGESVAKSNAGRDCRIAFVFGCPPRKVVAGGALLVGLVGGALLDHQFAHK
jgi:hypothetical protein